MPTIWPVQLNNIFLSTYERVHISSTSYSESQDEIAAVANIKYIREQTEVESEEYALILMSLKGTIKNQMRTSKKMFFVQHINQDLLMTLNRRNFKLHIVKPVA